MTDKAEQVAREIAVPRKLIDDAVAIFAKHGIDFSTPWDGDHDDLERERFETLREVLAAALRSYAGEAAWNFDMTAAPKDGSEIETLCVHRNCLYAKDEDLSDWVTTVRAHWIDHNGGGWTWHGLAGRFIAWRPAAPQPDKEGGR